MYTVELEITEGLKPSPSAFEAQRSLQLSYVTLYIRSKKMAILTGLEPAFTGRQPVAFPDGNRTIM